MAAPQFHLIPRRLGYDGIYAGKRIIELACWAHARRYFVDAESSDPISSKYVLDQIGLLYDVEAAAKKISSEARRMMRQESSKPILDELETWLRARHTDVLPQELGILWQRPRRSDGRDALYTDITLPLTRKGRLCSLK